MHRVECKDCVLAALGIIQPVRLASILFCVLLSILATERPSVGTALAASITTAITASGIASQRATIDGLVLERPCHELRRHLRARRPQVLEQQCACRRHAID